ncbi:MAG: 16S rRNA (uracil(1498)-N(3))-methyltransferase [Halioglobus sp.]
MNLLLFSADELRSGNTLQLTDRRLQHMRNVHGAAVGDTLRVGEIGGLTGIGRVESLNEREAVLSIQLSDEPPAKLPVTLVLALPRPKMLRRILRAVAEFGVAELHLINSYRVEKSFWQTPVLEDNVIHEYMQHGLEQSRDTVFPTVARHTRFKPFVEDMLPGLLQGKRGLLAHPGEWPPCPRGITGDTLLVVGPEGGFIPYEVEQLQQAGCDTVSLGPRILRVENAISALLARLF